LGEEIDWFNAAELLGVPNKTEGSSFSGLFSTNNSKQSILEELNFRLEQDLQEQAKL